MQKQTNNFGFKIRKIRNENPRNPRFYRKVKNRFFQLALIFLITLASVWGILAFSNSHQEANFKSQFLASDFLGNGFEEITQYDSSATNEMVNARGDKYKTNDGIRNINAIAYNIKDYFKYVVGGIAFLFFIIAAMQLVTASGDEQIKKGKDNLKWSLVALLAVFIIDVGVIALYEGGGFDKNIAGESLFTINGNQATETSLMRSIATYFQKDARDIFSYVKSIGGSFALLFIFMAGAHMISAGGNEENIEKEKKYLMHAVTAFVTLIMLDSFIFDFIYPSETFTRDYDGMITEIGLTSPECVEYLKFMDYDEYAGVRFNIFDEEKISQAGSGNPNFYRNLNTCIETGNRIAYELSQKGVDYTLGIVNFFQSVIGGIAIFFIVYSGIQIITSMGDEERMNKHKKQIVWSLAGLAIIVLSKGLVMEFFFPASPATGEVYTNVDKGMLDLVGVTNFLSTFIGIFATVSILIAGIIWVANFGNTEIAEKAKKVVFGAIVGVILSISAHAIVNSITQGNPNPNDGGLHVDTENVDLDVTNGGISVGIGDTDVTIGNP